MQETNGKQSAVQQRLDELEKTISVLAEAWQSHCQSIGTVIRSEPECQNPNNPEEPMPISSALSEQLRKENIRLQRMIRDVLDVTRRVEL